jgi:hypothetical protein
MNEERMEIHRKIYNKGLLLCHKGATNEEICNFFVKQAFLKELTSLELVYCAFVFGISMGQVSIERKVKKILGEEAFKKIKEEECEECKKALDDLEEND